MENLPPVLYATHSKPAPFACDGPLRLSVESNPFLGKIRAVVVERCLECGAILHAQGVLPEPELVEDDDGA